ncbi:serine acetyltransferase [Vibrio metoecus]
MKNNGLFVIIKSDLYRYGNGVSLLSFVKALMFNKGFKFTFWMRLSKKFERTLILSVFFRLFHYYYKRVYTSDIGFRHEIGYGFCMYHVFGTAFSKGVIIGNNVTIAHNVTIGHVSGLSPRLGNNIYVGPGACIIGDIYVGNNVVIGANCVVSKTIPDNAVVVGNPARIVSFNGATDTNVNLWSAAK